MATTKTLTPTNQTITIAGFQGEKPDQRQVADAEGKMADAINALNSQMARRAETRLNAGASASFTFSEYTTSALFFCTTGNSSSDTCAYVYSNGYLSPISQTSGVTVALSSDYKTVTFTNTTQRACYIGCVSSNYVPTVT